MSTRRHQTEESRRLPLMTSPPPQQPNVGGRNENRERRTSEQPEAMDSLLDLLLQFSAVSDLAPKGEGGPRISASAGKAWAF